MKILRIGAMLLVFCAIFLACPRPGMTAADEVKLGLATSKTGKFSSEGTPLFEGVELWADQVNSKGGVFVKAWGKKAPIKFIWYDDHSDMSTTGRLYEKLINGDKVDILIGPWGSGQSFASTAVTEKHKFPMVLTSAGGESIYTRGFNYIFQGGTMVSSKMMSVWGPFLSKYKITTVAVLYEDSNFCLELYKYLHPSLEKAGIKEVLAERYPAGTQDFSSLLMKIKSANPDGVILLDHTPTMVYVTRQMAELGIRPKFYATGIGPSELDRFVHVTGKLSLGIFEPGWFPFKRLETSAKEVSELYTKKYKKNIGPDQIHGYRAGEIWEQVLGKAQTFDKEEFNRLLHSETFTTIDGEVKYDERGVNTRDVPFIIQHLELGNLKDVVWPEASATKKPVIPYPYFR
jgi:branched-chain amino acid transport system substrate-binding protein